MNYRHSDTGNIKLQNNSSLLSNNKLKRREKGRQSGALQQTACPTTEMMLLTKNWNVIFFYPKNLSSVHTTFTSEKRKSSTTNRIARGKKQ